MIQNQKNRVALSPEKGKTKVEIDLIQSKIYSDIEDHPAQYNPKSNR